MSAYTHVHCSLFYALLICGLEICFMLVNMFINIRFITDPALILYVSFKNAGCQVVGTYWKYFLVGEMVSSRKEHIHDGRTSERKRRSPHHSGRREQEQVMKLKDFIMNGGSQYIEQTIAWSDKGRSCSLGFGRGANNSSPQKNLRCYKPLNNASDMD